jgi:hypothetical protein
MLRPDRLKGELWRTPRRYPGGGSSCRGHQGSAVLIVIILTVIMCALIVANTRVLDHLDRELKQFEREQNKRLSAPGQTQGAGPAQPGKSQTRP